MWGLRGHDMRCVRVHTVCTVFFKGVSLMALADGGQGRP